MTRLQELQAKRNDISGRLLELTRRGNLTDEERRRIDSMTAEATQLGDLIRSCQAETLDADLRQVVPIRNGPVGAFEPEQARAPKGKKDWRKRRERIKLDPGFERFLRTGDKSTMKESRDIPITGWGGYGMGVGSPTASIPTSVFVPQGFIDDVEVALKYYGEMYSICKDYPTLTGAPLPYPTSNDTAIEAEIVGEGQTVSDQDVTIGNVVLQAWKYSTKLVPVSLELLQDSAFDMGRFLVETFAIRIARKWEDDLVNGTGVNMPRGILLDAVLGATATGANANSGLTANTDANSIGTTDLLSLIFSVDPNYRKNGSFLMHDLTRQNLSQTLDKFGRPLYMPNPQTGKLDSIFGYPIKTNNYMPEIGSTSPSSQPQTVLFGDFRKYLVRRVKDLSVLRLVERAAEQGLVLFIGFARMDARLIDAGTHPIKYLQMGD